MVGENITTGREHRAGRGCSKPRMELIWSSFCIILVGSTALL